MEDLINFDLPMEKSSIIKVLGIGGGGSNAVNHMYKQGISDVDFIVCNTDQQALINSPVPIKIHLGQTLTEGLGAGNRPEKGREAAIENLEDVQKVLKNNTKMVFITAGMGGGTGTGAAPVIAKAAKDLKILTVGIVTIPFRFEGQRRIDQAINGVREISKHVDSLLVINNERLREIYGDLGISQAFSKADNVLTVAAKGIAEIITKKGHVNVDFADVQTVMSNSGVAIMGSASAEGDDRAKVAIEEALNSPLLNNNDITGAKNILLNISSGEDELTTDELFDITQFAQQAAGNTADLIWGYNQDITLGKKISVTIIATGFKTDIIPELYPQTTKEKEIIDLGKKTIIPITRNYDDVEIDITYTTDQESLVFSRESNEKNKVKLADKFNEEMGKDSKRELDDIYENTSDEEERIRKALERIKLIEKANPQKNYQRSTKNDRNSRTIDELENEPAYRRKNIDIQSYNYKGKEISRYNLSDDDDSDGYDLSENSFLHDNVD
jgi:cell division protein FtsZ